MSLIVSVTGHRMDKLGGYGPENEARLVSLAESELDKIRRVSDIIHVLTGMALGWDTAIAMACQNIKIPYIAVIPFLGQERRWPQHSQQRYRKLLAGALEVVNTDPDIHSHQGQTPVREKMFTRNRYLMDHADCVLTIYDGEKQGGTYNAIEHAEKLNVPIRNCFDTWA